MNKFRSHNCGELSKTNDGNVVHLSGWVNKKRDHGGLLFIDLRDHYGLTQCVFDSNIKNFKIIESLKLESVLKIIGKVVKRSKETINENLPTGEIEILVEEFIILNKFLTCFSFRWRLLNLISYFLILFIHDFIRVKNH